MRSAVGNVKVSGVAFKLEKKYFFYQNIFSKIYQAHYHVFRFKLWAMMDLMKTVLELRSVLYLPLFLLTLPCIHVCHVDPRF